MSRPTREQRLERIAARRDENTLRDGPDSVLTTRHAAVWAAAYERHRSELADGDWDAMSDVGKLDVCRAAALYADEAVRWVRLAELDRSDALWALGRLEVCGTKEKETK